MLERGKVLLLYNPVLASETGPPLGRIGCASTATFTLTGGNAPAAGHYPQH
jgi:hypothetical protein